MIDFYFVNTAIDTVLVKKSDHWRQSRRCSSVGGVKFALGLNKKRTIEVEIATKK